MRKRSQSYPREGGGGRSTPGGGGLVYRLSSACLVSGYGPRADSQAETPSLLLK